MQAENTVSVTPQIGGEITGVYFKKGQEVHKGQLLFTLDDRSAAAALQQAQGTLARDLAAVQQARATLAKDLAAVRQAQANLARDEATAQYAQASSSRYNDLYRQGAISQDQAQQYSATSRSNAATVQADKDAIANAQAATKGDEAAIQNAEGVVVSDQGAVKNAQVQLSYTKIYAPIDGRAGDILVNQGNVVQSGNSSVLVKIDQIHPIQVSFAVPESNLPEIQKYMQNGKLSVDITFPNTNNQPIRGTLSFVNNTVDNTTGTIQLMGTFTNANGQLWPGQYVNTTLTLTTQPNATVVPSQAVQNGPNGQFVFVAKPDMTVANVPVTVSSTINGLDVVQKGCNLAIRWSQTGRQIWLTAAKFASKQAQTVAPTVAQIIAPIPMAGTLPTPADGSDRKILAETMPPIQEAIHESFGVVHPPSDHDDAGDGGDYDFWVDELSAVAHQRFAQRRLSHHSGNSIPTGSQPRNNGSIRCPSPGETVF